MRRIESKYVVCPFYRGEESVSICCEGPVGGSVTKMVFGSVAGKLEYRRKYCETMSCFCTYGEALNSSYK